MNSFYLPLSKTATVLLAAVLLSSTSYAAGLMFHVDLGTFTQELAKEKLDGYSYVITKKSETEFQYTVGEYSDYLYAQRATNELRNRGFSFPKVVASFNSNPIPLKDAFTLLENQNRVDMENYHSEMPVTELNRRIDKRSIEIVVQVGVYSNPKNEEAYDLPFRVDEVPQDNGTYKYQSQSFTTLADAKEALQLAKKNGIPDAFIVAYKLGERIALSELE